MQGVQASALCSEYSESVYKPCSFYLTEVQHSSRAMRRLPSRGPPAAAHDRGDFAARDRDSSNWTVWWSKLNSNFRAVWKRHCANHGGLKPLCAARERITVFSGRQHGAVHCGQA